MVSRAIVVLHVIRAEAGTHRAAVEQWRGAVANGLPTRRMHHTAATVAVAATRARQTLAGTRSVADLARRGNRPQSRPESVARGMGRWLGIG